MIEGTLAMPMADGAIQHDTAPFFAFQKPRGSNPILIPDIDAVGNHFYSGRYNDTINFFSKKNEAVFAGATTGGVHTPQSVETLANQRLRSAVYFRDIPDVDFRLPRIVQCRDGAEDLIRQLGFGVSPMTWDEQLAYKFLISMDGNGATCSRVAIALKSNSILLKYISDSELYYFPALIKYLHYIPIYEDVDVISTIAMEKKNPGMLEFVARNGAEFFRDVLSAEPALHYTAIVLSGYFKWLAVPSKNSINIFDDVKPRVCERAIAPVAGTDPKSISLLILVHVRDVGDINSYAAEWVGKMGSNLSIEGFSVEPLGLSGNAELEYCEVSDSAEGLAWCRSGTFAGSRGVGKAISGVAFRISGPDKNLYSCQYWASVAGGSIIGPFANGERCRSSGLPIEAIKLIVTTKGHVEVSDVCALSR